MDEVIVDLGDNVGEVGAESHGGAQSGVEVRHYHGGRQSFASYITNGEGELAVGGGPDVAIIAADPHGWFVVESSVEMGR